MQYMGLNEIRERYLKFFESKAHLILPSFPLVPINDDSLLLINAGMAPLKPYFTGKEVPPSKRVTTCQKCIRTPDIERVGKTARHGTFFEMLGNFSFGDYFKKEVTAWAWEFITEELKLPKERLYVSVYEEDHEAYDIWTKQVGVDPSHMVFLGKEDNFWEIGVGPCGPCSEIYFDRGEDVGCKQPDCKVGCDCDRFVEFWNLVFTQFDKDEDGNYNKLAHPNIDTGMGLERIAAIMQGVLSLFDVDTIKNIMNRLMEISNTTYNPNSNSPTDVSLRVVTDHIRSTVFLVSDGVVPSNEGRGYVLRRLLRRAARHGKLLGIKDKFLCDLAEVVIAESKEAYPELLTRKDYIMKIISIEESKFEETIDQGLQILSDYIKAYKAENKTVLSGADAFKLYDTYGFPIDLTIEILEENNMTADLESFDACMNEQRERARNARGDMQTAGWAKNVFETLDKSIKTEFLGYDSEKCSAKIVALIKDNESVEKADGEVSVILDKTVLYGESGGQIGDTGIIKGDGFKILVTESKKLPDGKIVHVGKTDKEVSLGASVECEYDEERRAKITRNHSATHLLQKALTKVLGAHVAQAGSFVTDERLRFDFSHFEAMTKEQIKEVEAEVNRAIFKNYEVEIKNLPIDEARKLGATALFGEKYGEIVRVVKMGDYSIEFCGGCHLKNTGFAGAFKIISESGVASGVRRIEAVSGDNVLALINQKEELIENLAKTLKVQPHALMQKAESFMEEYKELSKEISGLKEKLAAQKTGDISSAGVLVGEVSCFALTIDGADAGELRKIGDKIKSENEIAVAVLAGVSDGKISFVSMATKKAVEKGVNCGDIIKDITMLSGGRGGGKPENAQGGGTDTSKLEECMKKAQEIVKAQLGV